MEGNRTATASVSRATTDQSWKWLAEDPGHDRAMIRRKYHELHAVERPRRDESSCSLRNHKQGQRRARVAAKRLGRRRQGPWSEPALDGGVGLSVTLAPFARRPLADDLRPSSASRLATRPESARTTAGTGPTALILSDDGNSGDLGLSFDGAVGDKGPTAHGLVRVDGRTPSKPCCGRHNGRSIHDPLGEQTVTVLLHSNRSLTCLN